MVGHIFGWPITNSIVASWIIIVVLALIAYFVGRRPKLIPGRMQATFEWLVEYVITFMEDTLGSRDLAKRFFPLITTIFIFLLFLNWFEFIPFVGSIGFIQNGTLVPLLRTTTTDLNMTLGMAIVSYLVVEITGISILGFLKYGSKFVNLKGGAIGFLIGLIEFVSNLARLISFSFRLYGNIFAGEVLIAVAVFFLPLVLPIPVMLFEVFVGLVQAAIFALLTLVFIKIAIEEPHAGEEHDTAGAHLPAQTGA